MKIWKLCVGMLICLCFGTVGQVSSVQPALSLAQEAPFDLQAAIDAAEPGAVIQVQPGAYHGNFIIEKPLTLEGIDWPILDGDNQGNVIEVSNAKGVTIRGLIIRNSGARLDQENAGIAVDQSPGLIAEQNQLENTLFGIYIKDSEESRIANNVIGAKDLDVPARGDGIRVWYSQNTKVIGNRVDQGRDVVLWYNNGAIIRIMLLPMGVMACILCIVMTIWLRTIRSRGIRLAVFLCTAAASPCEETFLPTIAGRVDTALA